MSEEDSLIRRLAGQSVEKAGLGGALDPAEINRIIAEASKGSKFYENERKKDLELAQKIERLIMKKEELMVGVNMAKVEASVDRMLVDLENSRDLSQYIVHVDCDAFYASVEVLDNPSLAGKAFGVSPGVLTTASYEARKYGVRSAMPSFIAKKLCPHLILVKAHFERYSEMSKQIMDILSTRDPNMAPVSVDEAYLNITAYCREHDVAPEQCVEALRAEVQAKTKLTVSAGIAPNKLLAKICSEKNKPNGQFAMPRSAEAIKAFMEDLPIRKVPGIGKVNERLLQSFGIKTCGDIYSQRVVVSVMDHYLHLQSLLEVYLGLGSVEVRPHKREERKSIGSERTFQETSNPNFLYEKLREIAANLEDDLKGRGFAARTVTLKYKLHTFKLFTRAKSCTKWVTSKEDLFEIGMELLAKEMPLKLRLIGLQASHLKDLRITDDQGIRKFLAPRGQSPSSKRRKVDGDGYIIVSSDDDLGGDDPTSHFGHEDDDEDGQENLKPNFFASDGETETTPKAPPGSKKPHSHIGSFAEERKDAGPSKPLSAAPAAGRRKPSSTNQQRSVTTLTCPVCSRELETDNAGLNEHIDFCLSRGAIMAASKEGDSKEPVSSKLRAVDKISSAGFNKKRKNPFDKNSVR